MLTLVSQLQLYEEASADETVDRVCEVMGLYPLDTELLYEYTELVLDFVTRHSPTVAALSKILEGRRRSKTAGTSLPKPTSQCQQISPAEPARNAQRHQLPSDPSRLQILETVLRQVVSDQTHQHAQRELLQQELDMTRVQREQQRQWNKRALRDQAEGYREQVEGLKRQVEAREQQQREIGTLRAEVAELKAGLQQLGEGERLSKPAPWETRPHDHHILSNSSSDTGSKDHDNSSSKEVATSSSAPVNNPELGNRVADKPEFDEEIVKEADLVKRSISARNTQWKHFLSCKDNYMFAPNLENGLNDILREIRQFDIRNTNARSLTIDLTLDAIGVLYTFTVAGVNPTQDLVSVPAKLQAWRRWDEFLATLLRGFKLNDVDAKAALANLEVCRQFLFGQVIGRGMSASTDSWFAETCARLEKASAQQPCAD